MDPCVLAFIYLKFEKVRKRRWDHIQMVSASPPLLTVTRDVPLHWLNGTQLPVKMETTQLTLRVGIPASGQEACYKRSLLAPGILDPLPKAVCKSTRLHLDCSGSRPLTKTLSYISVQNFWVDLSQWFQYTVKC